MERWNLRKGGMISDEGVIAAARELTAIARSLGRLAPKVIDEEGLSDHTRFAVVLTDIYHPDPEDVYQIFYCDLSGHRLGDEAIHVAGKRYPVMDGIAWSVSDDGLAYAPAFRMGDLKETEGGGLLPTRWFDEMGMLEGEDMAPMSSIWRIHVSDDSGAVHATPLFAWSSPAALTGVWPQDRDAFLEAMGSPWRTQASLFLRDEEPPAEDAAPSDAPAADETAADETAPAPVWAANAGPQG